MRRRTSRSARRGNGLDRFSLGDGIESLRQQAGAKASAVLGRVKAGGQEVLNVRKLQASAELSTLGEAFREASQTLKRKQSPTAAEYADAAAGWVEQGARYIDEADFDDLIADVQDLVRRQPAVFLAGMFVAGVAAARFLKATQPPRSGRRRRARGS
jgi:hypothetical protein